MTQGAEMNITRYSRFTIVPDPNDNLMCLIIFTLHDKKLFDVPVTLVGARHVAVPWMLLHPGADRKGTICAVN